MTTRQPVRVWVRALANGCRIRVERAEDARWLIDTLIERSALAELQTRERPC